MQRIAGRMFRCINVRLAIETDRVDHESIAFPFTHGVPKPVRLEIFWMIPFISVHNMENIIRFEEKGEAFRLLDDFKWILHLARTRVAPWHAIRCEVDPFAIELLFASWRECKLTIAFLRASGCAAAASFSVSVHI